MQLTKQTNYSLRILMYCAANPDRSRIGDIARFYDLSESFLHKILQTMAAAGFVTTARGRGGGIALSRPPAEIGLGEVVRTMEERFDLAECFGNSEVCPLTHGCGLNEALHKALDAFFEVLDGYTLADLSDNRRNIRVLMQLESLKKEPLELAW